jgi:hypothetical protein
VLGGLDPILIFNIFERTATTKKILDAIPFLSTEPDRVPLQPIPIYLSERFTGLLIQTETKSIDVLTEPETSAIGTPPAVRQKGLTSNISVEMVAKKDSIGVVLLSAMADIAFQKVTAQDYSITYLHGPVTLFNGLLAGFSVDQNSNEDLLRISLELSRARTTTQLEKSKVPSVEKVANPVPL